MNSENGALGKEKPPSATSPGQGTPVSGELVPLTGSRELTAGTDASLLPIVRRAGQAAVFAAR